MLCVWIGLLCILDSIDSGIRSGGELLTFELHLKLVAGYRFVFAGLQEFHLIYDKDAVNISSLLFVIGNLV